MPHCTWQKMLAKSKPLTRIHLLRINDNRINDNVINDKTKGSTMSRWWQTRNDWQALMHGQGCPMCATLADDPDETPYNYKILTMQRGTLYLQRNQYIKGYCVLIAHCPPDQHITELHQLSPTDRGLFLDDMVQAGAALSRVFDADKMNYELLGNTLPHLHAHIKPRYLDGPLPYKRIGGESAGQTLLDDGGYRARVQAIQAALGAG